MSPTEILPDNASDTIQWMKGQDRDWIQFHRKYQQKWSATARKYDAQQKLFTLGIILSPVLIFYDPWLSLMSAGFFFMMADSSKTSKIEFHQYARQEELKAQDYENRLKRFTQAGL